jgi:hypothetical protein
MTTHAYQPGSTLGAADETAQDAMTIRRVPIEDIDGANLWASWEDLAQGHPSLLDGVLERIGKAENHKQAGVTICHQ